MSLSAGTRFGPYEIVAAIAAGGMGEVYRARDSRLDRHVAIKLLPESLSSDAARRQRLEQEARTTGSLNHPNLLTVYDVGTHEGRFYIVSELLDGDTLRQRLERGALPVRVATDIGRQIAHGLAAAHARGVVHRDLKPENIVLTRDGRAKILDFGIATRHAPPDAGKTATMPGLAGDSVSGTAGYMAPEQIRGEPVDYRADLFALGAVLYEMLSGRRAFEGESVIETLHATLSVDPPEPREATIGTGLARVVLRCLHKDREQRFQSASDVAFALHVLAAEPGPPPDDAAARPRRHRRLWYAAGAVVLTLASLAAGFSAARRLAPVASTTEIGYRALTFRRGFVTAARFANQGRTIVYSAAWEGEPLDIFTAAVDRAESRSLGLPSAALLAVSATGDLAIALGCPRVAGSVGYCFGTLAVVPLAGGAPRPVLEGVVAADYAPNGDLAVVRAAGTGFAIEFPIGTTIYESGRGISQVRVSPDGTHVAFVEESPTAGAMTLSVIARGTPARTLSQALSSLAAGLVWVRPDALWVTVAHHTGHRIVEITTAQQERVVDEPAVPMALQDAGTDGQALLVQMQTRQQLVVKSSAAAEERDLSWFDVSVLAGISRDGQQVLFNEVGSAVNRRWAAYLRRADGAPAIRLSDGGAMALSHDGQHAVILTQDQPQRVLLAPIGPGAAKELPRLPQAEYDQSYMAFFPGDRRLLFYAREPGHGWRAYVQDLPDGHPRVISGEVRESGYTISPDGEWVIVSSVAANGAHVRCPVGGSARCLPVPGMSARGIAPIGWFGDGNEVFVRTFAPGALHSQISRLHVARGTLAPYRSLQVADPAGAVGIARVMIAPDSGGHAYVVRRVLGTLFTASGLR